MKKVVFLIVFFVMGFVSFGQSTPKSIEEALDFLNENWTEEFKTEFKNKEERKATIELHMNIGMGIRNGWLRHGKRKEDLLNEFYNLEIYNFDDMSEIILTSFHRKLNNKPIKINEQTQHYIDYWKRLKLEEKERIIFEAQETYKKFSIGNKIDIYYPVFGEEGALEAFTNVNILEWKYNENEDLKISGIILDKYYEDNNVFFNVKITELNREDVLVHLRKIKIGDVLKLDIREVKTSNDY